MKKILNLVVLLFMCSGLFYACKKNVQDKEFKDVNRINIEGLSTESPVGDSVMLSFAVYPTTVTEYSLTLVGRVAGTISDKDRVFKVEVDPAKTTADASEYVLPSSFVIKAGTVVTNIPIKLKRSARIANRSVRLSLKISKNDNFDVGKKTAFNFVWTDDVVLPQNWTTFYWGKYSKVKHRLMLASTPYTDLNLGTNYAAMMYVASATIEALTAYNNAHPGAPLRNEFGAAIAICNGCE